MLKITIKPIKSLWSFFCGLLVIIAMAGLCIGFSTVAGFIARILWIAFCDGWQYPEALRNWLSTIGH